MSELDEFGYSKDFERCHLGDVAHIEMGQSPDSRFVFEDPYIGYPFLQGNAEFGVVSPSPKFGCVRPTKLVKKSDVLVSVRAPVGAVNIADRDYCIGRGLAGIRLSGIEPNLAAQLVQHQSADLRRVAQGTTFEAISKSDLQTLQLRLPPVAELPVIAQLLDTLDTAIHQTEAIVEKLKQVKQGLLHDLLTRGVDANGELRPSRTEAPELYQSSPMGWIPKAWSLESVGLEFEIQLGKMLDAEKNLGVYKTYIGNKAVQWGGIDMGAAQFVKMTRSDLVRFRLAKGDLLVCEGGEVGRAAIWDEPIDECYYQKALHRLRPLRGYSPHLMLAFLRYWTSRDMLADYVSQTSIAHLTQEKFASVPLPVPERDEQLAIAARLMAQDAKAKFEDQKLSKMREMKSGLMDDLLTGRVRVTPLLAQ